MSIEVKWIQKNRRTIMWTVDKRWTYNDYHRAVIVTRKMIAEQAPKQINVVLDMRTAYMVPTGVISAIIECHYANWLPENYGHAIVVSKQPIIRYIYSMLVSTPSMQGKVCLVETMEETEIGAANGNHPD